MKDITIIGAGLSGSLLIMNLLRRTCEDAVHIRLIDKRSAHDLGPAYSTNENYLLNVPAGMMGAFSQDPEHFLKWTQSKGITANKGDYLPRKLYREYIQAMVEQAWHEMEENKTLERIRGEVTELTITGKQARLFVRNYGDFLTDKVVLALGNSLPKNPQTKNRAFISDKRYSRNPWNPEVLTNLSPNDDILFIGTGQTMVDLATGLYKRKHRGKMTAISRRGILPLSQKMVDPYPSFFEELRKHSGISGILRVVRKHIGIARQHGSDSRAVIDSLRPHTTAIWMQLPTAEKRRFLRHVFRYWEIIRSRIPPQSENIIRELQSTGQLKIIAGKIIDLNPTDNSMKMVYSERGSSDEKSLTAKMVINCMGPNQDYDQIKTPFIKNLVAKKLIACDPVHLGINALPDGRIIKEDGNPSDVLYTIGLTLKGIVWESLATPEIRVQAENLAASLLVNGKATV
jgi:uncharacterized NAD(P)/FAD-binding protein YdhS